MTPPLQWLLTFLSGSRHEICVSLSVLGGGGTIVAPGRVRWVWDIEQGDGKGEQGPKMGISCQWSADHRVVEGAGLRF